MSSVLTCWLPTNFCAQFQVCGASLNVSLSESFKVRKLQSSSRTQRNEICACIAQLRKPTEL